MASTDDTLAFNQLEPNRMLSALEELGYRCDGRFLTLNSYENRVYQVGLEDGNFVVAKFYRPGRWSDEAILEEHAFCRELADLDVPVVAPLLSGGQSLHRSGPFRVSVFPYHRGRAPELDDEDSMRQLGRLVARIHLAGANRPFRHRVPLDVESYGTLSVEYLLGNDCVPEDLLPAYTSVADEALSGVRTCFRRAGTVDYIRLHGDFHPGNVLARDGQLKIVDLDDARPGPAIQDIWMFLSGDRAEQTPQLATILDGYQEFRSINPRELHLIEALRTLRIMHYAAWLARRSDDPAFQLAFPWFWSRRYWEEHVLNLREQIASMREDPLHWYC